LLRARDNRQEIKRAKKYPTVLVGYLMRMIIV